jgi:hypothetical protein
LTALSLLAGVDLHVCTRLRTDWGAPRTGQPFTAARAGRGFPARGRGKPRAHWPLHRRLHRGVPGLRALPLPRHNRGEGGGQWAPPKSKRLQRIALRRTGFELVVPENCGKILKSPLNLLERIDYMAMYSEKNQTVIDTSKSDQCVQSESFQIKIHIHSACVFGSC